jgi:RNA polymerase sigma factor (sigma-70 family)
MTADTCTPALRPAVSPLLEGRMMGTLSVPILRLPQMDEAAVSRVRPTEPQGLASDPASTMDLVQRARSGDQAALDALFSRYEIRLRRWAHGRLPGAARGAMETQDLVQDTLIKVFNRLPAFEPRHPGAFRDYVWTTLWNAIRDVARAQTRRGPSDAIESDIPSPAPSPLEQAMGSEVFARYEAAMDRLRPEEREAVIARVELGLSHAEVAEALGKPSAAAAHMAVSRALVRLAEEMAHERSTRR